MMMFSRQRQLSFKFRTTPAEHFSFFILLLRFFVLLRYMIPWRVYISLTLAFLWRREIITQSRHTGLLKVSSSLYLAMESKISKNNQEWSDEDDLFEVSYRRYFHTYRKFCKSNDETCFCFFHFCFSYHVYKLFLWTFWFKETLIPVATSSSSQLANPSPKINAASNNGDDSQHDEQLLVDKESLDHDGDFSDEE